jgi:hypothetical protein
MLQKIPEMLSLIEHQKYKRFLGRTPDPHIFLTKHLRAGVKEKKVKLGRAKLPKEIRVGEPNNLCCIKCKFKVVIY